MPSLTPAGMPPCDTGRHAYTQYARSIPFQTCGSMHSQPTGSMPLKHQQGMPTPIRQGMPHHARHATPYGRACRAQYGSDMPSYHGRSRPSLPTAGTCHTQHGRSMLPSTTVICRLRKARTCSPEQGCMPNGEEGVITCLVEDA